jgi:excisionase family DNA binding protein
LLDDILDADQVGKMLRVHSRTVIRLAKQAKLPGFKVGDQWRFRREAIEQYIREQEQRYIDRQKEEQDTTKEEDADKKE